MTIHATQRAAMLLRPMAMRVAIAPLPPVGENQVRVRLQGCGICASNIALWEGRPWFEYPRPAGAPGHEGWGVIDCTGAGVRDLAVGDRVALVSGNAYAEYDVASRDCVVRLPPELDSEPFPGEPLGCAMNIFERSRIRSGQKVAIVGTGFLGLLLTQLAANAGAHVVAISRRDFALRLATQMGAEAVVNLTDGEPARREAMQIAQGHGYERVIEAAGLQSTLDFASGLVAERGRLIIAGYHQDGPRQVDMQQWNWRGIDVVNAHERQPQRYVSGIERAVQAVLEGTLDPFPLLTHRVALESLDTGFDLARTRPDGFVKALLLNGAAA